MKYNLDLFGRIAIVGLLSSFIHSYILVQIGSNSAAFRIIFVTLSIISGILIGLVLFVLIQKLGHVSFQNKRVINILCVFLAIAIISPAIIEYYTVVPPNEIRNDWQCIESPLCNEINVMNIQYDQTIASRDVYFIRDGKRIEEYKWKYDRIFNEIIIYESKNLYIPDPKPDGWNVKLRVDINKPYMITYYISSSGKTPIDARLFDGVTWTTNPHAVRGPYYKDNTSITYVR